MKILHHGEYVRLPDWDDVTCAFIYSNSGYWRETINRPLQGDEEISALYTGSALVSDGAYYEQLRERVTKATTIVNGEVVVCEGVIWKVRVKPGNQGFPHVCDPIAFIKLETEMLNEPIGERK